ncbi:putative BNR repeat neuraminidase [Breznakibacter xylanolyticus]|uniref:Putative BNR repeat neuraminidase n=1 Tax=Breznakibacter xylanolyticus TaxID=990 RepID=A0A2W7NAM4_9BACT|nr:BNR repeat-containing protein [Breznakibacter xylanolyticus]PZX15137.1 putative BNR repeat neuraminidase [Breznakibacter xylanolyticus]
MIHSRLLLLIAMALLPFSGLVSQTTPRVTAVPVAPVPASFPVNFALHTVGKRQYVAFYDSAHQMTIGMRRLNSRKWQLQTLPSRVGWDSHNYLSLAVDDQGLLHLSGNMHSSPLIYFRSSRPHDITSLQPLHAMTGHDEEVTTYPEFMHSPAGDLLFHYRYGRSGSGYEVYNRWNPDSLRWERLLDQPLTDGQGRMNAYMQGPVLGPDGFYHLIWVWRNTPDCSTNHTLSHARSRDLIHWESIRGQAVSLPITLSQQQLHVDTTRAGGGLINIGIKIGFDSQKRLVIGYHKYDPQGNTQLFLARYENNQWMLRQITQWNYRWDFKGMGTIVNELLIDAPQPAARPGQLTMGYHHFRWGDAQITVDEATLAPIDSGAITTPYPPHLDVVRSPFKGMLVHKVFDSGRPPKGHRYLLRWEALPPNRDRKPQGTLPQPGLLEVVKY